MPTNRNSPVAMFRVYSSSGHSLSCQWVTCREWRHYFSSLEAVITWLNARPIDPPTHGRDVQTSVITLGLRRHAARRRVLKGGVIRTLFSCHITCWCKKLSSQLNERRPTQFAMPLARHWIRCSYAPPSPCVHSRVQSLENWEDNLDNFCFHLCRRFGQFVHL
jgi:hypothetical protein